MNKEEKQKQVLSEVSALLRKEHLAYKNRTRDKFNDLHERGLPEGPTKEVAKYAMKRIPHKNANVIDFGCGSGSLAKHLKKHQMYIGVDVSDELVNDLMKSKVDSTYFLHASITQFTLPKRADIGYCINTLECIEDDFLQKALLKISEAVSVCIFCINSEDTIYTENQHKPIWWLKEIETYFDIVVTNNLNNHLVLIGKSKS